MTPTPSPLEFATLPARMGMAWATGFARGWQSRPAPESAAFSAAALPGPDQSGPAQSGTGLPSPADLAAKAEAQSAEAARAIHDRARQIEG